MDKYVLVSGANGGIGSKIVKNLFISGYKVIALDKSNSNLDSRECIFIECDLTNKNDLVHIVAEIKKLSIRIDAIINAIGIFKMQSLIEGSEEEFRQIIEINFFSVYSLNKALFPFLNKDARIINLTSEVAKYSPQPLQAYYNLSKIILDAYTDALRRECNYLGIKVIKIQSGSMKTSMLTCANDDFEKMVSNSKYFKEPMTKLKHLMDKELKKQNDPLVIAKTVIKILKIKNPKICYRIKNSAALSFMGHLPEKVQDEIYTKVIK